jgi:ADP-dependent NAD(P)H-hydrate dehydratase / NAD(P)H-hydrate epimerase
MALEDWLEPLFDATRMREIDRWAIEDRGVPSLDLMERAGAGLARSTIDVAPEGDVVVVCGKGNNGGDGLVAARVLRQQGREVTVVCAVAPEQLQGDARTNLERLPGAPPQLLQDAGLPAQAAVIVDAVLGTGFSGEARGEALAAIEAIEAADALIVAADVPSGVDASTGVVSGRAVSADVTTTFHAAKPGLWINPGKAHAGEVRVIEIGVPPQPPVEADIGLIRRAVLERIPRRQPGWTKFTSGHVLIAGGSRGLTGAPCLVGEAAMRAGAGYVTACIPGSLSLVFETRLLEVMTRALPDDDGSLTSDGAQQVLEVAQRRGGSLVVGPGLGREAGAVAFARELAAAAAVPLVLDADGLNAHAQAFEALAERQAPTVLTPHAGELGRLLGIESAAIEQERLRYVREAAAATRAVVVLKGDDTLVAAPDGVVAVNTVASAALATAGTGDVLSGVIGALLARKRDPFIAACAGVHLHGLAGRRAASQHGVDGVIASDVIAALPRVRAD